MDKTYEIIMQLFNKQKQLTSYSLRSPKIDKITRNFSVLVCLLRLVYLYGIRKIILYHEYGLYMDRITVIKIFLTYRTSKNGLKNLTPIATNLMRFLTHWICSYKQQRRRFNNYKLHHDLPVSQQRYVLTIMYTARYIITSS